MRKKRRGAPQCFVESGRILIRTFEFWKTDKNLCLLRPGYLANGPQNAKIVNENVNRYVKKAWLSRFMRLFLGFESLLLRQNVENPAAVVVAGFFVVSVAAQGLSVFFIVSLIRILYAVLSANPIGQVYKMSMKMSINIFYGLVKKPPVWSFSLWAYRKMCAFPFGGFRCLFGKDACRFL